MVDFGSEHVSGVALFAKTEGLSYFETAGIACAMSKIALKLHCVLKRAPVGHSLGEA